MPVSQRKMKVADLVCFENLHLKIRAGASGLENAIIGPDINRPAMEIQGFTKEFRPERIQLFGRGESSYILEHNEDAALQKNVRFILSKGVPCLVVTHGRSLPEWGCEMAEESHVPLLETELSSSRFALRVSEHLEQKLAPRVAERGVLMDIYGVGVLIMGLSGVGKSECALELVTRGHTFVADDIIEIRTHQESTLIGTGRCFIPHHMEIRGIGIIDINRLFGPTATRAEKQIDLAATLEDWRPDTEYDRLGIDDKTISILDVPIPWITLPVRPGRNLSTIIEVAALNQKLKAAGVYMAREFDRRLIAALTKGEEGGEK